ncbi:hypothetical protein BH11PLA2_BH11PLA2_42900 [soil metagenome]
MLPEWESAVTGSAAPRLKPLAELFRALADPHRLWILQLLHERGEQSVKALSDELQQSQPAVSHHLTQLRQSGLIDYRRSGKFNYYHLDPRALQLLITDLGGDVTRLQFAHLELRLTAP